MLRAVVIAASLLLAGPTAGAVAQSDVTEWPVPWAQSRPRDPFPDAQGRIWFVGQVGNYIAYLVPETGKFQRFEIDPGTHPHNLIIDGRGSVWFTGNANGTIGRLDPGTGKLTRYPMPDPAAGDPHTLVLDPAGDIWFTVQQGNFVGKLTVATGAVRLIKVPTANARPYGIVVDRQGRPWFCEFGTNRLGTVDPKTFALREIPLPDGRARPRRIALTSDGSVWFADYIRGTLGRLDPATGKLAEWPLPARGSALPYAMAADDRDRLWIVETGPQPNRLVGFDSRTGRFVADRPVAPSGALVVRHMVYDRAAHALWMGTDANTIVRAKVPDRPCAPDASSE
jgi:virginiamycin B lyase